MSQEVFEIVKKMNLKDIQIQFVLQCAPLIARLKIANLLIIRSEDVEKLQSVLTHTDISHYKLLADNGRTTLLLYRKSQLREYLRNSKAEDLLIELGYEEFSLEHVLAEFKLRYEKYMENGRHFPHEMGLLLGYPLEDIFGFIYNNGKNFLCNGYWKVYGNMPEKVMLFEKFERAKETMIQLIFNGVGIGEIVDIYSNDRHLKISV